MSQFGAAFMAAGFLLMAPMASAQQTCPPAAGVSGLVSEIVDGDTLVLESGLQVRLVGIQAPKLPLGRAGFKTEPMAPEARVFLEQLAAGKRVDLRYGERRRDRHGRALAHVTLAGPSGEPGHWLQWEMLHAGLARVYSFADNRLCIAELLAAERAARKAGRGIWALDSYQILTAQKPGQMVRLSGSYQIVEGRIESASRRHKWVFVNFDRDWQRDFTIVIPARHWKWFQKAGYTLSGLKGRRIRVRGWLGLWNGPMIEADHPEQIERLD